jgi:hypothetical protein
LDKGGAVLLHTVIVFLFTQFDATYFLVALAVAFLVLVYVLPVGKLRLISVEFC